MLNLLRKGMLVACCSIALPSTALATTQGTSGSTSSGTLAISATIPGRVQITGLTDLAFGTVDPASAASKNEDLCVWSNTSGRGYEVTATGSGASNAFTLTDGTNTLTYAVQWAGTAGQSSGTALTAGTALTGLTSAATNPTCSAGVPASASLIVNMSTANLQAAVASTYNGTLTLVVAPQ